MCCKIYQLSYGFYSKPFRSSVRIVDRLTMWRVSLYHWMYHYCVENYFPLCPYSFNVNGLPRWAYTASTIAALYHVHFILLLSTHISEVIKEQRIHFTFCLFNDNILTMLLSARNTGECFKHMI